MKLNQDILYMPMKYLKHLKYKLIIITFVIILKSDRSTIFKNASKTDIK